MDPLSTEREGVVNYDEALATLEARGQRILHGAVCRAEPAGVSAAKLLLEGQPAQVILHESERFDLVVMSSRNRSFVRRVLLGSVTEAVLHHIARPLLVVEPPGTRARLPG
jgi:nucleotide-binding universal stress UspA family protein